MRSALLVALIACGGRTAAPPQPTQPAAPAPAAVTAPLATPAAAGRAIALLDAGDRRWILLDEAGIAQRAPVHNITPAPPLPFSEPVADVVFLRWSWDSRAMYCARARSGNVECNDDSATAPQRYVLPTKDVRHIAEARAWHRNGGMEPVLCTLALNAECWWFDGKNIIARSLDPAAAFAGSIGLSPAMHDAWRKVTPAIAAGDVADIARTDGIDSSRVVGARADITTACARLTSGELSCHGIGVYGELGDGKLDVRPRTTSPLGNTKVLDVATGRHHVCAVTEDGRVACWGELPEDLPLPRSHKTTPLPMCRLDRAASKAAFDAARASEKQRAQDCARGCGNRGRDACLGCTAQCTPLPYLFEHSGVCQEPLGEDYEPITERDRRFGCVPPSVTTPQWETDSRLRDDTPDTQLTLMPVYLDGITDAIGVALPGRPSLCILRRSGVLSCIDDTGALRP